MSYNKLKVESYSNISGINSKTSGYVTGDKEFLDIQNFDFQVPGALSKRWGFTAAYAASASFGINIGSSQAINSMWQVSSVDYSGVGLTIATLKTLNLFGSDSGVFSINGNIQGSTLSVWVTPQQTTTPTQLIWDHSEFRDSTYYSNGVSAWKSSAGNTVAYRFGMSTPPLISGSGGSGLTVTATSAGTTLTGTFVYAYAYLDSFGFVGRYGTPFIYSTAGVNSLTISGFTTFYDVSPTLYDSTAFGATAYVIFRNRVSGFPSTELISIGTIPIGATTFVDDDINTTNQYSFYPPFSATSTDDIVPDLDPPIGPPYNSPNYPNRIGWTISEVYQNRLWIDSAPNVIAFSESEEMQNFLPENFRIISSNNFRFTSFKTYNQSLMILCQKGIFRLTGDTPENFNVTEMSREYGCISDKSVVVFNERMWFLDYGAIIEFNGANFTNVGNRVDSYLKRMNVNVAYRRACAMHIPDRNEIWFAIPIDGATANNCMLVYDYLVDGWTTFTGTKLIPTSLASLYATGSTLLTYSQTTKNYYFGSIGGSIYLWGSSFLSDNGNGMTLSFTTKYHNELGKSQTAQFRRFYLDIGGYTGATLTFGVQMYANYSTLAVSATAAINIAQWQERIDFGVPAKSLSFKVSHGSTTGTLSIGGYSVEYRFQRSV